MPIKFFNTLTKKKEEFKPIKKGKVLMYSCGPTVYSYPHIGNYRSFLVADLIRRYLEFRGFQVKQIMNITDIDDKTIRDSAKEGLSLKEFTEKYTKIFFDGLDKLNIRRASVYPKATEEVDGMIEISVKDNGCGIAKKYQERIFERFYVVDKSRSRKLGGTGLGLAIVKHIAEVHGGYVTVQSIIGAGSTFTISLPAD